MKCFFLNSPLAEDDDSSTGIVKTKNWTFYRKYPTAEEAEEAVKSDEMWSKMTTYSTSKGERVTYRCNKARKDCPCPKGLYLLYHCDSQQVSYLRQFLV